MGEKELTPAIRFKGFTDPWEQRKLGNIASLYQPHTISSDDLLPAGIPVFGANGYIGFYSEANHWVDQVTISARGEEAGTPNYVVSPAWITGNSMVVNTDSVEIDKKFLYFNLCATPLKKFVTGGAQPQLTRSVLGKAEIAVTVIVEERAISSILGCLSSLIALHQRKLEKLQRMKQALLEKLFPKNGAVVPELRFNGFTDAWEQRKLGDLGSAYSGMTGKSRHDFGHGDARYITYLNVFSQPLLNDQIELGLTPIDRKQTEVKSGDALFTISSEVPEEIAISAVWQSTRENVYLNSFCFGVRPYRSCDSVYFAYALRSPSVRVSFMLLAQGISRYNISKLRALDVLLPWPSEDEQNNVGSFFARADRLIALHQRKLEKLQQLKSAFLTKMFV